MDFGTSCAPTGRRRYLRLTGRTHHIPMSAATMTGAVPMAHGCTVTSAVHRALCANRAMFRSKVLGRAGRRHGYQRRSCDGRAQPRAVWATPRSAERAPASDGADDREKRQSDLSFPSVFVTAVNATSRLCRQEPMWRAAVGLLVLRLWWSRSGAAESARVIRAELRTMVCGRHGGAAVMAVA